MMPVGFNRYSLARVRARDTNFPGIFYRAMRAEAKPILLQTMSLFRKCFDGKDAYLCFADLRAHYES